MPISGVVGRDVVAARNGRMGQLAFCAHMLEFTLERIAFAAPLVDPAIFCRKGWLAGRLIERTGWSTTRNPLDLLGIHHFKEEVPPGLIPGESDWIQLPELLVTLTPSKQWASNCNIANNITVFEHTWCGVWETLGIDGPKQQEGGGPLVSGRNPPSLTGLGHR